jgi:hypothetical protein
VVFPGLSSSPRREQRQHAEEFDVLPSRAAHRLIQAALAVAITLAPFQGRALADTPDPYQVFGEARARWNAQHYPPWIAFTVVTRLGPVDAQVVRHYGAMFAPSSRSLHVELQSDEERAAPYVPRGTTGCVTYSFEPCEPDLTITRETGPDPLGVPLLSPIYSFGLVAGMRGDPNTTPAPAANLQVIATVQASRRDYNIEYLGQEPYAGGLAHHLRLTPLRRPSVNRIRAMWVDAVSHDLVRLDVLGNFQQGPSGALPWTVTFQEVDGLQYLETERCDCTIRISGKGYNGASLTFENVKPQSSQIPIALQLPEFAKNALTEPDVR